VTDFALRNISFKWRQKCIPRSTRALQERKEKSSWNHWQRIQRKPTFWWCVYCNWRRGRIGSRNCTGTHLLEWRTGQRQPWRRVTTYIRLNRQTPLWIRYGLLSAEQCRSNRKGCQQRSKLWTSSTSNLLVSQLARNSLIGKFPILFFNLEDYRKEILYIINNFIKSLI